MDFVNIIGEINCEPQKFVTNSGIEVVKTFVEWKINKGEIVSVPVFFVKNNLEKLRKYARDNKKYTLTGVKISLGGHIRYIETNIVISKKESYEKKVKHLGILIAEFSLFDFIN